MANPQGILFDEDRAIKAKVTGIQVTDRQKPSGRDVPVWFRLPTSEERSVTYPMITLDFLNITPELNRAHAGRVSMDYLPNEVPYPSVAGHYSTEYPVPYVLDYLVTTYARDALHDRQLVQAMLQPDRLPMRFGYLDGMPDNTIRRLDVLGWQPADVMEAPNKRLFRKMWTVQISSEMIPFRANAYLARTVQRVVLRPPTTNTHPSMTNITTT